MIMSSSIFQQNTADISNDIEDIRQQNRYLYEENATLKRSLQELITINTELTQSIEEFNTSHSQNFPHINQQEIQQLALRVIELEQELERERREHQRDKIQNSQNNQNNNTVEETLKVIEELVNSLRTIQEEYQNQLRRLEVQLQSQKTQWVQMSEGIQQKLTGFQEEYSKLLQELKQSQHNIRTMEMEIQEKNRNMLAKNKEMKISTTIQDLKTTLERQIEEKDKIIRNYQMIIDGIRGKLSQKVAG